MPASSTNANTSRFPDGMSNVPTSLTVTFGMLLILRSRIAVAGLWVVSKKIYNTFSNVICWPAAVFLPSMDKRARHCEQSRHLIQRKSFIQPLASNVVSDAT